MKKEYFLLIFAIIALSAYLIFNNKDKDIYDLPELTKIDEAKIQDIVIIKPDKTINCFLDNGKWVVTQNKYLSNSGIMEEIITAISSLTITTLISEKPDLKRYDLDREKAIKVIAKGKDGILREFSIGKPALTQKHTFIAFANQNDIFYAKGNLRRLFNKSIDNLRDKQIQKFDKTKIEGLEISKGDIKRIISIKEISVKNDKGGSKKQFQWGSLDNKALNQESVGSLIEILSDLRCSNYIEDKTKNNLTNETPLLVIDLKEKSGGGKGYNLNIMSKSEDNKYTCISAQSDYVFVLESYVADDIISNTDKVLNIEKESKNGKGN